MTQSFIGKPKSRVRSMPKWFTMLEYQEIERKNTRMMRADEPKRYWKHELYERTYMNALVLQTKFNDVAVTRNTNGKAVVWVKHASMTFLVGWAPRARKVGVYCFDTDTHEFPLAGIGGAVQWIVRTIRNADVKRRR